LSVFRWSKPCFRCCDPRPRIVYNRKLGIVYSVSEHSELCVLVIFHRLRQRRLIILDIVDPLIHARCLHQVRVERTQKVNSGRRVGIVKKEAVSPRKAGRGIRILNVMSFKKRPASLAERDRATKLDGCVYDLRINPHNVARLKAVPQIVKIFPSKTSSEPRQDHSELAP